jgi:predicted RNA-binding protein with PUA-like domain
MQVVREAYPDLTAQDKSSKYFDTKATADDPRWSMVDFKLVRQVSQSCLPCFSTPPSVSARLSVQLWQL